jgi:hypothetical protein
MMRIGARLGLAAVPFALAAARPPLTLDETLQLAGRYVDRYERRLGGIVAEEHYRQTAVSNPGIGGSGLSTQTRTTQAYLLSVSLGSLGWLAFRDVYRLDGRPVRGREERLSRLLQNITPDSLAQARTIAAESARYNLNPSSARINRTLNLPLTALLYVRTANQRRSTFTLGKADRVSGITCATLQFVETTRPRIIGTSDDAPAQGTFWIDTAAGGRLIKTELRIASTAGREVVRSTIAVTYARVDKLDVWLPTVMHETYVLPASSQTLTAHATYSDFREFTVSTSESIK